MTGPAYLLCVAASPCIDKLGEVERVEPGKIHRLPPLTLTPGGKGLNVARAAAALGTPVRAVGFLAGHAGRWIAESLASWGVEGRFIWTAGETRHCLSIRERARDDLTEFYESPTSIRSEDWSAFLHVVTEELRPQVRILTISGGLPPGAPTDGYAELCALARSNDAHVLLDTHGEPLGAALASKPWLVKVNAEEASDIARTVAKEAVTEAAMAHALIDMGASNALITLGLDGALLGSPEGDWRVGPAPIVGGYPVGSGDAFLAGVAVRLLAGDQLVDATHYGAAVAAANALRPGAGILEKHDIDSLFPQIQVSRLP